MLGTPLHRRDFDAACRAAAPVKRKRLGFGWLRLFAAPH